MEPVEITPEPDRSEREAILEALATDQRARPAVSEWARMLLPSRDEPDAEP